MTWTPLEFWANITTVLCIFLAGRNSVHTWWTGIIACGLFGWLFYDAKLYADVLLQVFFVATSIVGWWNWNKFGQVDTPITDVKRAKMVQYVLAAIAFAGMYGAMLNYFTDAWSPWVDSMNLSISILAQLLLMSRKVENWPAWVVVNAISVPLYFSRELYLTAGLYAVFFLHAIWAWRQWTIEMKKA